MNKIEFISKLLKGSERLYDLNKVDEENLFWLDEENAQYEERQ